jgi:hypothetical protein
VETPNEIEALEGPAHDHSFYFGIVVPLLGSSSLRRQGAVKQKSHVRTTIEKADTSFL